MPPRLKIKIKASEISQTIDLRGVFQEFGKRYPIVWTDPVMLTLNAKKHQYLIITRYGVIALTHWTRALEEKGLALVKPFLHNPITTHTQNDEINIIMDSAKKPKMLFDTIIVPELNDKTLLIASMLLCQSVGLESYEKKVDPLLEKLSKEVVDVERSLIFFNTRALTKNIIEIMRLRQELATNLDILNKPDLTWDDATLDFVYTKFVDNVELAERTKILSEKFKLLENNTKTALDMVNTQRMVLLEFAIVALFVLDIIIYFFGE